MAAQARAADAIKSAVRNQRQMPNINLPLAAEGRTADDADRADAADFIRAIRVIRGPFHSAI